MTSEPFCLLIFVIFMRMASSVDVHSGAPSIIGTSLWLWRVMRAEISRLMGVFSDVLMAVVTGVVKVVSGLSGVRLSVMAAVSMDRAGVSIDSVCG